MDQARLVNVKWAFLGPRPSAYFGVEGGKGGVGYGPERVGACSVGASKELDPGFYNGEGPQGCWGGVAHGFMGAAPGCFCRHKGPIFEAASTIKAIKGRACHGNCQGFLGF